MNKYEKVDFYSTENHFKNLTHINEKLILGDLNRPVPKYTILIPTFRRAELLEKSLLSAINQKKIKDYEIVIVEHGQIDDSTEKMLNKYKKYNNLFFYQLNEQSNGGAWIKGSELVRTEWFTLLCDDDLLFPNYLFTIDKILKNSPEIQGIVPKHDFFYYNSTTKKIVRNPSSQESGLFFVEKFKKILKNFKQNYYIGKYIPDDFYIRNGACLPLGAMYKKENFFSIGGWNIQANFAFDMILHLNYVLKHNLYYSSQILAQKREWDGNGAVSESTQRESILICNAFFKTMKPYLKVIPFNDKYTKMITADVTINGYQLNYEDIKEYNLEIPEEYFTKAELTKFKAMREAYLKKLAEANPPLLKYSYTLCNNFRLEKFDNSKIEKGVNIYVDFIDYLKKKKAQQKIDSFAKKYKGKKIVLYGAGIFTDAIIQNYNLSDLDIIAIADIKFDGKSKLHDYPIIDPESLKNMDFDVLMISMYKDYIARKFFKNKLFKHSKPKFKIDSLIKMSLKDRCADLLF